VPCPGASRAAPASHAQCAAGRRGAGGAPTSTRRATGEPPRVAERVPRAQAAEARRGAARRRGALV
jgi:hypothetical protein